MFVLYLHHKYDFALYAKDADIIITAFNEAPFPGSYKAPYKTERTHKCTLQKRCFHLTSLSKWFCFGFFCFVFLLCPTSRLHVMSLLKECTVYFRRVIIIHDSIILHVHLMVNRQKEVYRSDISSKLDSVY